MIAVPTLINKAVRVYNLYFREVIVAYNRYYLTGNLSLSHRLILNLTIMYSDVTDPTGFPVLIKYNGVNYTNFGLAVLQNAFICLVDKDGKSLHMDLPLNTLSPNLRANYSIGGNIDFTKSYIYWTSPPATINNVIPIKLDYV